MIEIGFIFGLAILRHYLVFDLVYGAALGRCLASRAWRGAARL